MQVVGGVLGHAQRAKPREVEVHLGGRLGAGRQLELDLDAVDGMRLTGVRDVDGGHDQRHFAGRGDLPQAAAHLAPRAAFERRAVHVGRAAGHRGARVDVLLHRVFGEVLGGDDRYPPRVDVGLGHDVARGARRRRGCGCRSPR